jgi:hypothetical protein
MLQQDMMQVVEQARQFLNIAGYAFTRLVSVTPDEEKHVWAVRADVGLTEVKIKEMAIDDRTGKVIGFQ